VSVTTWSGNRRRAADPAGSVATWTAVRALPPRQRTVIALRYYAELPVAEVADLMGCSPGTVKSQTAKAIARLRQTLEDQDPSDQEVSDGSLHE